MEPVQNFKNVLTGNHVIKEIKMHDPMVGDEVEAVCTSGIDGKTAVNIRGHVIAKVPAGKRVVPILRKIKFNYKKALFSLAISSKDTYIIMSKSCFYRKGAVEIKALPSPTAAALDQKQLQHDHRFDNSVVQAVINEEKKSALIIVNGVSYRGRYHEIKADGRRIVSITIQGED